jgi:hypothetical protein
MTLLARSEAVTDFVSLMLTEVRQALSLTAARGAFAHLSRTLGRLSPDTHLAGELIAR